MTKKILIVEDEEALANVLEAKLKKEGHDVKVGYNGETGYDLIKSWQPDLILLDIVMPKMNGYEVLEKMKDEKIEIPVIIISNSGQPVEIEKTKKLGAVDHLIKTEFEPKEVVEKVNKYLDGQEKGIINDSEQIKKKSKDGALGAKILLVEDDEFLKDICSKKLVNEGFEVYEAIDGEQALAEVEKIKPDLILLDIILPSIDGFQVLEEIKRSSSKKIAKTPIIMLSNLGQESDVKKAIDLGATDYMVKAHFTTEEIVKKVKEILAKNK